MIEEPSEMTPEEIMAVIGANTGKRLSVTFLDGVVESVLIGSVDAEGFVHSEADANAPETFWTRFTDVRAVRTEKLK